MPEDEARDKIAKMNAEFDQFRAAIKGIGQIVCDYKRSLKESRLFTREEQFMLTMEFQTSMLQAVMMVGLAGANGEES